MSMTVDWHSMAADGNKSEECTTGRQDFMDIDVHRLTFLSFRVRLDLQHHSGDGISVHVIQRVGNPLRRSARRDRRR